jgi:glycogen operon protein
MQNRTRDKVALMTALRCEDLWTDDVDIDDPLSSDLMVAIHAYMAKSNALLAITQIEDLALQTCGVNLPGTDRERPNWRYRLNQDIATLFGSAFAHALLKARTLLKERAC